MILQEVTTARRQGARLSRCARTHELDTRTLQRWAKNPGAEDGRRGPLSAPHNKLTEEERAEVLATANQPEYRDLSPKQIVPKLADNGCYVASESTMYR